MDRLCARKPATVLDIGCGTGRLLSQFQGLGHVVRGVEPDPVPREFAKSQGLDVHPGFCEALPESVQAQTFNVIVLSHMLHNCIDPALALHNVAGRLAPGGRLVCEVPNQACLGARWAGIAWGHLDVPRQLNVFTRRSLCRMIEQASLEVEEVQWTQYCRQFDRETIEQERRKYDFFKAKGAPRSALPLKPSVLSRYALLACSLFGQPHLKYDAMRVIARKS
jgi:SAM-dependent methyltransferase